MSTTEQHEHGEHDEGPGRRAGGAGLRPPGTRAKLTTEAPGGTRAGEDTMRHFHLNAEQTNAAAAAIRGQHERIKDEAEQLTSTLHGFDLATGTATRWDLDRARAILPKVDLFSGAAEELDDAGEDEDLLFRRVRRLHHRSMSAVLNADLRTGDRHDLDAHRTMVAAIEDAL